MIDKQRIWLTAAWLTCAPLWLHAQLVSEMDESKLYAQSKQVNQFFRRFNGEEDEKGNRYYPNDRQYRNPRLRKKFLATLFDEENKGMSSELKAEFAKQVLDKENQSILDFHEGDWFAEVETTFETRGKPQAITLFMELQQDHQGYKWVISKVHAEMFDASFLRDTTKVGRFLHPLSHELDFMNLRKAFADVDSVSQFASRQFRPDHLSVFLYEVQRGNLKFKSVSNVKFHFFQIDGWYFELAAFNRPGYNTGWLISNLVKLTNPTDKEHLRKYLVHASK